MMRAVVMVSLALLGGCATAGQRQQQAIVADLKEAIAKQETCIKRADVTGGYLRLAQHLAQEGDTPPALERRTDPTLPTQDEVQSLVAWRSEIRSCQTALVADVHQFAPSLASAMATAYTTEDQIYTRLQQREISWGAAVSELKENQTTSLPRMNSALHALGRQLTASSQAEMAQRRASASVLSDVLRQQPPPHAPSR